VRARCVAGDGSLSADFSRLRGEVLGRVRDHGALLRDVGDMRRRMRAELDRSDSARFDLKQGEGGLVDLEFLLQALVLEASAHHAPLRDARSTPALLEAASATGLLPADAVQSLRDAHAVLVDAGLRCTLDRRSRLAEETDEIAVARRAISDAVRMRGLAFGKA
jgi:glutamate-ammonia-ligase adenylyltransferase